jgi:hypothetical protein
MAIFIEIWSGNLFTLRTVDRIENNTPLGDVDSRVLKEVVKENLESQFANELYASWRRTHVVKFQALALVEGPASVQHLNQPRYEEDTHNQTNIADLFP